MAEIVELGPHARMTPEQALAIASQEKWEDVVICGFQEGEDGLVVRTSRMSREFSLWIAEHFKLYAMGRL